MYNCIYSVWSGAKSLPVRTRRNRSFLLILVRINCFHSVVFVCVIIYCKQDIYHTVKPFNLAALKVGDLACTIILAPLFWRIKTIQFEILACSWYSRPLISRFCLARKIREIKGTLTLRVLQYISSLGMWRSSHSNSTTFDLWTFSADFVTYPSLNSNLMSWSDYELNGLLNLIYNARMHV